MKIRYGIVVLAGLCTQGCLGSANGFGNRPLTSTVQAGRPVAHPVLTFTGPTWQNGTQGQTSLSETAFPGGFGIYSSDGDGNNPVAASDLIQPPTWCTLASNAPQLSYLYPITNYTVADLSAVVAPVQGSWINSGYTQCVKKGAFTQTVVGGYTKVAGAGFINASGLTIGHSQGYHRRGRRGSSENTNKSNKPSKLLAISSKVLVDTDLTSAAKSNCPFLLNGQGEWQVVPLQIQYAIQNPSTFLSLTASQSGVSPVSIPYSSAALVEFFSARLAMASSAFVTSYGSASNSDFLNRTINKTTIEQDIITDFSVQAQLLFSWACYLRNIMTPSSYNIGHTPITQASGMYMASGYTLGALDTFAGVVVINPYASHGATDYLYTVSGKNKSISIPALDPTDIQQVVFVYDAATSAYVATPVSRLASFDGGPSAYRFSAPGFTAFQDSLTKGQVSSIYPLKKQAVFDKATVTFLPVSNFVNGSGRNTYAVQEPADNWWLAPVANPSVTNAQGVSTAQLNSFRQVTFQPTQNPGQYFTYGVGSVNTALSPQVSAPNSIVYGANTSATLVNGNLPDLDQMSDIGLKTQKYGTGQSALPNCYNDPNYTSFFADLQPWAIAVQIVVEQSDAPITLADGTSVYAYGYAAVPVGLIKLNSFDFPLVFAQNPIASAYTANSPAPLVLQEGGGQTNQTQSAGETLTVPNQYTNLGIAFTQRDVWQGPEKLYSLVQSPAIAPKLPTHVMSEAVEGDAYQRRVSTSSQSSTSSKVDESYSMAYLFLQALYNGHLYSSGASNSLYSAMKTNENIKGYDVSTGAGIGSVSYDYTSENSMTLYPLTTTFPVDSATTETLRGVWPINEPRPEPAKIDWLSQESPVDWVFLRALMVMRAFIENTGITELALPCLPQILAQPNSSITSAGGFDLYIGQNLNPTAAGSPAYQTVYQIVPPVQPAPQVVTPPSASTTTQSNSQNPSVNAGSNGAGLGGI